MKKKICLLTALLILFPLLGCKTYNNQKVDKATPVIAILEDEQKLDGEQKVDSKDNKEEMTIEEEKDEKLKDNNEKMKKIEMKEYKKDDKCKCEEEDKEDKLEIKEHKSDMKEHKQDMKEEKDEEEKDDEDADKHEQVEYEITFKNLWCEKNFTKDFPKDARFSTFVGTVHNSKIHLWKEGGAASKGMKVLAEKGKNGELEKEIKRLKKKQYVSEKFFLKGSDKGEVSSKLCVSQEYPLVSIAAKLDPSPDWFTGVDSISLCENGKWVDKKIVMVYAYDAGTREGYTYTEKGKQTKPQCKIMRIERDPFLAKGELVPVGCFIFEMDK